MKDRTKLGRNVEAVMRSAAWTQDALGQEIDASQSTLSRLLVGQLPVERQIELAEKIAKAMRVPVHLLLAGTELTTSVAAPCVVTLEPEAHVKWLAYFASALTGRSVQERKLLDVDAATARQACEEVQALLYEPAWYTDPETTKRLSAQKVYAIDRQQVSQSHFLILDGRYPSFGAGQELEIAVAAGLPVLLLEPRGVVVSRMVKGTYARLHPISFAGTDDLLRELRRTLTAVIADLAILKDERSRIRDIVMGAEQTDGLPARVRRARTQMKLDLHVVARLVGYHQTPCSNLRRASSPIRQSL